MVGVDTKASTCPVAAALASSLAPCSIAMDNSRGRGPGWGARTSGGQRMRQNVALWNFTALASARACTGEREQGERRKAERQWLPSGRKKPTLLPQP
jgi:hypothetical protein